MSKLFLGVVASALTYLVAISPALAETGRGGRSPVSTTARNATGSLATARASSDGNQLIGCSGSWSSSGSVSGTCFARNATGTNVVSGMFSSTTMGHAVAAIGDNTRLQFSWDTSNHCTSIYLENASYWAPMAPVQSSQDRRSGRDRLSERR